MLQNANENYHSRQNQTREISKTKPKNLKDKEEKKKKNKESTLIQIFNEITHEILKLND